MSILGPNGEVLDRNKPEMTLAPTASLKLHFTGTGGKIEIDESTVVRFPRGDWIIVPMATWARLFNSSLAATMGKGDD